MSNKSRRTTKNWLNVSSILIGLLAYGAFESGDSGNGFLLTLTAIGLLTISYNIKTYICVTKGGLQVETRTYGKKGL